MIVEKYGGTSVADVDKIKAIAKHVADIKKRGHDIVVVASAMGKTTNALIQLAKEVGYAIYWAYIIRKDISVIL